MDVKNRRLFSVCGNRLMAVSDPDAGKVVATPAIGAGPDGAAFDPATGRWTTLAPLPEGRHGFGAAVLGDRVFFAGGSLKPGSGGVTDQLIVFSLP